MPHLGITGYPSGIGANQMCALPGSSPGTDIVTGTAYMTAGFQYSKAHIWRNFGILIGWFLFYMG
jgi:ABC-type multidrug transport system permease subunit